MHVILFGNIFTSIYLDICMVGEDKMASQHDKKCLDVVLSSSHCLGTCLHCLKWHIVFPFALIVDERSESKLEELFKKWILRRP